MNTKDELEKLYATQRKLEIAGVCVVVCWVIAIILIHIVC